MSSSKAQSEREEDTTGTVRRRQHHIRSRKGCATCKVRHIRCDERMPYCKNCVRVGRVCIYTTSATSSRATTPDPTGRTPFHAVTSGSTMFLAPPGQPINQVQHMQDAQNFPEQISDYYPATPQDNISSIAFYIVQKSYQLSTERPVQDGMLISKTQDYLLRGDNELDGLHECVQYALVSFGAHIHDQATKSTQSKELSLSHACAALKKLQHEINNFSALNASVIMTASITLAGAAPDWDQWMVFIEGYSRALAQIRDNGLSTLYPELLSEHPIFPISSPGTNDVATLRLEERDAIRRRINGIIGSIKTTARVVGSENWRAVGFWDLEQLAITVLEAIDLESKSQAFRKLSWLRSWMFWIEWRKTNDDPEQLNLSCHFYALVAASVRLYPIRYSYSLPGICIGMIEKCIEGMGDDAAEAHGLLSLLNATRAE